MHNRGNGCPTEAPYVYTNRKVGVKTSSPTKDIHVNGSFRAITALVDSVLNVWQVIVADALSIGGNVTVGGLLNIGQLTISGSSINSATGNISFGNNNLLTTGNITAGIMSSSNISALTSDVSNLQSAVGSQQV